MVKMRITKRITTQEKVEYIAVCPRCAKRIIGSSESQVVYNMTIHDMSKHKK